MPAGARAREPKCLQVHRGRPIQLGVPAAARQVAERNAALQLERLLTARPGLAAELAAGPGAARSLVRVLRQCSYSRPDMRLRAHPCCGGARRRQQRQCQRQGPAGAGGCWGAGGAGAAGGGRGGSGGDCAGGGAGRRLGSAPALAMWPPPRCWSCSRSQKAGAQAALQRFAECSSDSRAAVAAGQH